MISERAVHLGIDLVAAFVLLPILFGSLYDLRLSRRGSSLGSEIANWSYRYPLFAGALVALLGAMLGHFFTQR